VFLIYAVIILCKVRLIFWHLPYFQASFYPPKAIVYDTSYLATKESTFSASRYSVSTSEN